MPLLEQLKEHPLRYMIPWGLTVARPMMGGMALYEARKGNWKKAEILFAIAGCADADGTFARLLDATSPEGAKADPIADGLLRAEAALALAPEIPLTSGIVAAGETYNLWKNKTLQAGREKPLVPKKAKAGTVLQSAGAVLVFEGLRRKSNAWRFAGEAALLAGTGIRTYGYCQEQRKMKTDKEKPRINS